VLEEDAPNNIFVDPNRERSRHLLGNLAAAEAGIAPFHPNNCSDELF
jgi:hypothetical protein